ncbi:MAG: exo-beta-N-acetylmuramidase NamZ family protein [Candidatus Acidiferrales bacterium]
MLAVALFSLTALGADKCQPAAPEAKAAKVLVGIDVLEARGFVPLRGKRVGLITNQTGRTSDGRRTVDVLAAAEGVKLVALFSPEHGWEGQVAEGSVGETVDAKTGLRVHSLYGTTTSRRPTEEMLKGIDVLVFDIQDAGVRYFTYGTTMAYAMEEAAKRDVEFVVLDRPNPLNGVAVNGPMLDPDRLSFEGYFPLPLRHGMTLGELARLYNAENKIGAKLTVVEMKGWPRTQAPSEGDPQAATTLGAWVRGWRREMWFDDTGLEWVNPSPNLRSLTGNTFYPAVELLRAADVAVGRGTGAPFERFGAPWIDAEKLAAYLDARRIPGVRFHSVEFTPTDDVHAGKRCGGVRLELTDREALDAGRLGVELISALWKLYPKEFQVDKTIRLLGSKRTLERIRAGDDPVEIVAGWEEELKAFREMRAKYLLYD